MKYVKLQASFIKIDNPGGPWLEEQIAKAKKSPLHIGGSDTAWIKNIALPIDMLNLPGVKGEHKRFHLKENQERIAELVESIRENGLDEDREIMVVVRYDGSPAIWEGNHRIQALKILKYKRVPVKIFYNAGGERESGPFEPKRLEKYT